MEEKTRVSIDLNEIEIFEVDRKEDFPRNSKDLYCLGV
jgi:hypothetical protein